MNRRVMQWTLVCLVIASGVAVTLSFLGFSIIDIVVAMLYCGIAWSSGIYSVGVKGRENPIPLGRG